MSKYIRTQDADKRQSILINRDEIVYISQNGSSEVLVSFTSGDKIKVSALFDDFVKLVESGSHFEQR